MGQDRFGSTTGLPLHAAKGTASEAERLAVAVCRAKVLAARKVFNDKRKATSGVLRQMLAGASPFGPTRSPRASTEGSPQDSTFSQEMHTNLFLQAQLRLKADASDEDGWTVRCPNAGDLPDDLVEENESFHERIAVEADAMREFGDAIDDGGTVGPMILRYGIDRVAVNRKKQAGAATPIADIVNAAASGDVNVHPPEGMDYLALAKSCRDFRGNPEQGVIRTMDQLDNLTRVAQEADAAWVKEMELRPEGYEYGAIWARRVIYGEDVLWDSRVTTRWQDARWVAFFLALAPDEAQGEEAWKPSARKDLNGIAIPTEAGWPQLSAVGLPQDAIERLNRIALVVEFWDRDTGEVHYFTEGGGYDGFLERDSRYPYLNAKGRSIFKNWFPMGACTPVVHNLRVSEHTLGIPWLEPGKPHAIQYCLFDTALTESRGKAGSIIEYPDDLPDPIKSAIERGAPRTLVPRPAEMDDAKPLIIVHEFGDSPVDFEKGMQGALVKFARAVNMTVEEISGQSMEDTLGQAEMAASGSRASRGGLVRKLQAFAGEVVRDLGCLAKNFYTDERVTELMGAEFTVRRPAMTTDEATGEQVPVVNPETGEPALEPSVWEMIRTSSIGGDNIQVVFSPGQEDLMRVKSLDDFMALAATPAGINPVTGLPFFDLRPQWERLAKARGLGRLKKFEVRPEDVAAAQAMMPQAPPGEGGGEGGPPGQGGGKKPGEQKRTDDTRSARDGRGAPVPGRQGRNEGKRDIGDQSVRAHRVGTA